MFEMIGRKAEVGLVPREVEAMLAFYRDVIGLKIHSESQIPGGVNRRFLCGTTVVKHLCLDRQPMEGVKGVMAGYGLRQLTLVLPDFDAAIARLAARGGEPRVSQGQNLRYHFTEDPDGNVIELVGHDSPDAAGAATVQVGMTVADPARTRAFYEDLLGRSVTGVKTWRGHEITTVEWGPAQLKFWRGGPGLTVPDPVVGRVAGIRYLTALVEDAEGLCVRLADAGVPIPMPPRSWTGGATIAFAADPDGVLIEFASAARAPAAAA